MKILYLITKSNWGGAQRYTFNLAVALAKNPENRVIVGFGGIGGRGADTGTLAEKLTEKGIRYAHIISFERDMAGMGDLRALREIITLIRKENPDVIHINSSKAGGLGTLAARIFGVKKIVYTAHGWAWNESRPFLARLAIIFASWLTIIFSTDTIVIHKKDFRDAARLPFARKKLRLIHNGIAPLSLRENVDIRSAFPNGTIIVGTIAELHLNKGLSYLVHAAKDLPENTAVAIVGTGEMEERLRNEITLLGLKAKVKLFGFVPAERALPNFDIFILPSVKEGLPYTLIEAGSAGLPVIATRVGGVPDIIPNDACGIIIQPRSPKSIADAIKTLSDDDKLRKNLGVALSARVRSFFTFDKMVADTIRVYER